jgi:hypothetical protein
MSPSLIANLVERDGRDKESDWIDVSSEDILDPLYGTILLFFSKTRSKKANY